MSWVFNGRAYETAGNTNSDFMIKTKGKIKIQWGDKFIDLIKDGKINTESDFLNSVKDPESIGKTDGLYYTKSDGSLWVVIGGNKINLKGDIGNIYVSYMAPQDTTLEQKKQAQYNIGLVYKTMAEAQAAGITSGFVYIEDEQRLLIGSNGELMEYQVKLPNPITEQLVISKNDSNKGAIMIVGRGENNSLNFNNDALIYYDNYTLILDAQGSDISINNAASFHEDLVHFLSEVKFDQKVTGNRFESENADSGHGFRLYYEDLQSTLEVDNLIVRNGINVKDQLYPIKYYQEENILELAESTDTEATGLEMDVNFILANPYQGEVDDYLCTFVTVEDEGQDAVHGVVEVNFKVKSIDETDKRKIVVTETKVITENEDLKSKLENFNDLQPLLTNKHIYYMAGKRPVTRIENHNIDLLNVKTVEEEQDSANVSFRIGSVRELEVDIKGFKITDFLTDEEKVIGIYSDNAVFENPYVVQPELYISENPEVLDPKNTNTKIGKISDIETSIFGTNVSNLTDKEYGIFTDNLVSHKAKLTQPEIYVSESDSFNNITTKVGDISEVSMKNGNIGTYTSKKQGIYSDNAVLEESTFIKTKQYNTEFKKLDGTYPKYEEGWTIPEESDDQTIATTLWVQTHLKPMKEDIKKNRTDIDINAGEISSLWSALGALGDEVGEVEITVEGNTTDISGLETDITELQNRIKELEEALSQFNPNGTYNSPVVLFSGIVQVSGGDAGASSLWYASGSQHQKVSIGSITKQGSADGALVIPLTSSDGTVVITGVWANQNWTSYMDDHFADGEYEFRENEHGGHWFQTSWENNQAVVREFHQQDRNNCTWQTGSWNDRTANKWSVLIMGYII